MKSNYDVFISFADEDKSFATHLYDELHQQGIRAWCSAREVGAAESIYAKVREALAQSKYFLLVISEHYGRPWHKLEFDNAAHVRAGVDTELIIPVMYGVDYQYIENNEMFSLITSLRMVDTYQKSVEMVAEEVKQKIIDTNAKGVKMPKPSKIATLLRNRIVQMCAAAVLLILAYVTVDSYTEIKKSIREENRRKGEEFNQMMPIDSFADPSSSERLEMDFSQNDEFDFEILSIRPEKDEPCTVDRFAQGYTTLIVELMNNTSQPSLVIKSIQVEAKRNSTLIFEDDIRASLFIDNDRSDCSYEYGVIPLEMPYRSGNARYEYMPMGKKKIQCEKGKVVQLPVFVYQSGQKGEVNALKNVQLIFTFLSNKNNIEAMSRRCSFNDKGECKCEK